MTKVTVNISSECSNEALDAIFKRVKGIKKAVGDIDLTVNVGERKPTVENVVSISSSLDMLDYLPSIRKLIDDSGNAVFPSNNEPAVKVATNPIGNPNIGDAFREGYARYKDDIERSAKEMDDALSEIKASSREMPAEGLVEHSSVSKEVRELYVSLVKDLINNPTPSAQMNVLHPDTSKPSDDAADESWDIPDDKPEKRPIMDLVDELILRRGELASKYYTHEIDGDLFYFTLKVRRPV